MNDIIILGGGGHAKVIISIIKKIDEYNILGYVDLEDKGIILGIPYLGTDSYILNLNNKPLLAFGIGQIKNFESRKILVDKFHQAGFVFEKIISPDSVVNEGVKIGEGTVIMDGVVVQADTKIGDFSILNTHSSIDHDCIIGNFVHIAPGATLCGGVEIEDNTLIGSGVTIIQYKKIIKNSIIQAGSTIIKT